jgi:hypothetical protein
MLQPNHAGVIPCEFAFGLVLFCSSGWAVQGLLCPSGLAMRESCFGCDMDCLGPVHVDGQRVHTVSRDWWLS